MSEIKKITEEELNSINTIQTRYAEITAAIGQLTIQKELNNRQATKIDNEINKQWEAYNVIQSNETSLGQSLKDTYGDGTLDIVTGEFIPAK